MEFEGRNREEALNLALVKLNTQEDKLEVKVIEEKEVGFIFKKKIVRISVDFKDAKSKGKNLLKEDEKALLKEITSFVEEIYRNLDVSVNCKILKKEDSEIIIEIESDKNNLVIGKNGSNIDSVQFLSNIVANRFIKGNIKVILDSGGYRDNKNKYYENVVKKLLTKIRKSGGEYILKKTSPSERKHIYSLLYLQKDIKVKTYGDDFYKDVKIYYFKNKGVKKNE